jgi:hypothetical protein
MRTRKCSWLRSFARVILHSGRESSIVDPMRLADWPMAYIGDMVPLAL